MEMMEYTSLICTTTIISLCPDASLSSVTDSVLLYNKGALYLAVASSIKACYHDSVTDYMEMWSDQFGTYYHSLLSL